LLILYIGSVHATQLMSSRANMGLKPDQNNLTNQCSVCFMLWVSALIGLIRILFSASDRSADDPFECIFYPAGFKRFLHLLSMALLMGSWWL